jgi:hypothetical protein
MGNTPTLRIHYYTTTHLSYPRPLNETHSLPIVKTNTMFFASLIGLLVSLTAFTAPASSLPINEVLRAPRHDGYLEDRAMETECKFTPQS